MKDEPRNFHFLGICGTAMGSVAAALRDRGFTVTGSDESIYPPMSTFLESRGVALNCGYKAENIPADAEIIVDRQRDEARQSRSGSGAEP